MKRSIVRFRQDEEAHWVALLDCGHPQHTRHDPPHTERDWVLSVEGRTAKIGEQLDCVRCDRHELPEDLDSFHRSPVFTEDTLPDGLRQRHQTKAGVWARIDVLEGRVSLREYEPFDRTTELSAGVNGILVPEVPHQVSSDGPFRMQIEFFTVWAAE